MYEIYTTIYKTDKQDLLYSTGNYIQCLVITYNGKESEKVHMCVYKYCLYTYTHKHIYVYICTHTYISESFCYTPETSATL